MIFTFYKARGMSVGSSLVEDDKLDLAKRLEEAAKSKGVEFILPTDVIAADKFDENANTKVVAAGEIPEGWMVSPALLLGLYPILGFWATWQSSLGNLLAFSGNSGAMQNPCSMAIVFATFLKPVVLWCIWGVL